LLVQDLSQTSIWSPVNELRQWGLTPVAQAWLRGVASIAQKVHFVYLHWQILVEHVLV
jgi:hypothetical protein